MPIILSLLSGKGGCGKTTIALALSKMLSDCGIKVLLVDCDVATNGATYFFESRLIDKYSIITLFNLVNSDVKQLENKSYFEISENFHFLPSNIEFPNKNHFDFNNLDLSFLKRYDTSFCEIVILDCQAGYSDLLREVIGISNINLTVLEPDAISSSAMRVLYAQLSDRIERNKTYQIFNKITKEEYEIYNKVFAGTFFDALPPIMFNWEVRKSFAYAQVPEMITTNLEFGSNVHQLARILFPAFERQLAQYTKSILSLERENLKIEVDKLDSEKWNRISSLHKKRKRSYLTYGGVGFSSVVLAIILSSAIIISSYTFFSDTKVDTILNSREGISTMIALIVTAVIPLFIFIVNKLADRKKENMDEEKSIRLESELIIKKLTQRIIDIDNQIGPEAL